MNLSRTRWISTNCFAVFVILFLMASPLSRQVLASDESAIRSQLISLAKTHFPNINTAKIRVKKFSSSNSFFKARFSVARYVSLRPFRHLVYFNPAAFEKNIPDAALAAILVHELDHVSYYTEKNRIELIGLACLVKSSREAQFERKADLAVIQRGFETGLVEYREWLFRQITEKDRLDKLNTYLSPREIRLAAKVRDEKPEMFQEWQRKAPLDIEQMRKESGLE